MFVIHAIAIVFAWQPLIWLFLNDFRRCNNILPWFMLYCNYVCMIHAIAIIFYYPMILQLFFSLRLASTEVLMFTASGCNVSMKHGSSSRSKLLFIDIVTPVTSWTISFQSRSTYEPCSCIIHQTTIAFLDHTGSLSGFSFTAPESPKPMYKMYRF